MIILLTAFGVIMHVCCRTDSDMGAAVRIQIPRSGRPELLLDRYLPGFVQVGGHLQAVYSVGSCKPLFLLS